MIEIESQNVYCSIEDLFASKVYTRSRYWPEMKWLEKHKDQIKSGCILDIGANQGITAIYYAKLFPDCLVYAIEPSPYNLALIIKNISINSIHNICILPYAAYSDSLSQVFISSHSNASFSNTGISVPTVALDSIPMQKLSFVKIDIEGAEIGALRGLANLLARDRPLLDIEIHLFTAKSSYSFLDEILSLLADLKYSYTVVDGYQGSTVENLTSASVLEYSNRQLINLLACPQ